MLKVTGMGAPTLIVNRPCSIIDTKCTPNNICHFFLANPFGQILYIILYKNVSWDDSTQCKLVHKKCHLKSYHVHIKYHITRNNVLM